MRLGKQLLILTTLWNWTAGAPFFSFLAIEDRSLDNQGLVQVAYSPASSRIYLGSPSILSLSGKGKILCSHDTFPRGSTTYVLESSDGGTTWSDLSSVPDQYWSNLFEVNGTVYLLGTTHSLAGAAIAISASVDDGASWEHATLFNPPEGCTYATGATPALNMDGHVYRGFEIWCGSLLMWPQSFQALLLHAPSTSYLLDPASWSMTEPAPFVKEMIPSWMPSPVISGGYLEGNAVPLPDGRPGLLLRCQVFNARRQMYSLEEACLFALQPQSSEPETNGTARNLEWQGFLFMPGGGNKFTVRYDKRTNLYLSLTNPSIDRYGVNPDARNTLVLVYSSNLIDWRIATTILTPNDGLDWDASLWFTGYHYADWEVADDDILMAVRTAYNGAHSYHDSNRITFKRLRNYAQYLSSTTAETF